MNQSPDIQEIIVQVLARLGADSGTPAAVSGGCNVERYVEEARKALEIWHWDFGLDRRCQIIRRFGLTFALTPKNWREWRSMRPVWAI